MHIVEFNFLCLVQRYTCARYCRQSDCCQYFTMGFRSSCV